MPPQQANVFQVNAAARSLVLQQGVEMTQKIFSQTIANPGTTNNVLNIAPRNVGLIKRFIVEVTATVNNSGANPIVPTQFGPANILSQIVFNDLNNNVRINTTGWHMNFLNSAKFAGPFGAAETNDITSAINYGSNWSIISQTASVAAAGNGTIVMKYVIPMAYSDDDLTGAIYANVVNATMNLQLTVNPAPVVPVANDFTNAVYQGTAAAGSITSITITVYQQYLDQLPVGKGGPILPILDLSTIYEMKNTSFTGIVAAQDFPMPYSNFRKFLSTFMVYDNGVGAGGLGVGADINYIALQSANFTNIFNIDPQLAALLGGRMALSDDWPKGVYYFPHRRRPIDTIQFGNMQLVLNASTVNPNAVVLVGYEDFAMVNTITGAGSLAGS